MRITFAWLCIDQEINMGIASLSAVLRSAGHETRIIPIKPPPWGDVTPERFIEKLKESPPDLLAFSSMTFHWHRVKSYIEKARNDLGIPIICGGYHSILRPDQVIQENGVDYACSGDGESPLLQLVRAMEEGKKPTGIPGLWIKKRGIFGMGKKIEESPPHLERDLDSLPAPDCESFGFKGKLNEFFLSIFVSKPRYSILPFVTGRGCPHRCTYCNNSTLIDSWGGVKSFIRRLSPGKAIENLKSLTETLNPQFIEFWDELFLMDRKWTYEFCKRYGEEIGSPFAIITRVETIDEDVSQILSKAECKIAAVGVECGNEEYRQKYLGRKMTNGRVMKAVQDLRRFGIRTLATYMIGLPFETADMIRETLEFSRALKPDILLWFIYHPLPGTPLFDLCKKEGLIRDGDFEDYSHFNDSVTYKSPLHQPGIITEREFLECCKEWEKMRAEEINEDSFQDFVLSSSTRQSGQ